MTIALRDDVSFVILNKIKSEGQPNIPSPIDLKDTDFTGLDITRKDLLGHLDYFNEYGYIQAEFSGDPYGGVDLIPETIRLEQALLTEKGQQLLEKMQVDPPQTLEKGKTVPIPQAQMSFLEKVMVRGGLPDIFDARDLTVVVYRTMRDVMSTAAVDRVASELHTEAIQTEDLTLKTEVATLWQDTNPIVAVLSRLRPPLEIDEEAFLFRIQQEGGVPKGISAEQVIRAVFAATKELLSPEREAEVREALPGQIRQFWQDA